MALGGRTRSTRGLVIVLVTISLVTITIDYRQGDSGPLAKIGDAALTIITPLQKAVTSVTRPIGTFFTGLFHSYSLEERVRVLQAQIDAMQTQHIRDLSLEKKYEDLIKLIDLKNTLHLETTGAQVIGSGVSNFEWSITIDKGSSDGIHRGMAVVAAAGLVGNVTQTGPFSSRVTLILDSQMHV